MTQLESNVPADTGEVFSPIRWQDGTLHLFDQTRVPREEVWLECARPEDVAAAIYRLSVRGAPAIGVSAAYGLVVGLKTAADGQSLDDRFAEVAELLGSTRPTAVNLRWAIAGGTRVFAESAGKPDAERIEHLLAWAKRLHEEDIEACRKMGAYGAELFEEGNRVLTHCNTGSLATAGYGTALGVIRASWHAGRLAMVWVDETRPLLQGARLTTWELEGLEIPYKPRHRLERRVAHDPRPRRPCRRRRRPHRGQRRRREQDRHLHRRRFSPTATTCPSTSPPRCRRSTASTPTGDRHPDRGALRRLEVTNVFGTRIAPNEEAAANFAFDVTPNDLIAAIITDAGVLEAPYTESIADAFARQGL